MSEHRITEPCTCGHIAFEHTGLTDERCLAGCMECDCQKFVESR